ncbi:MAG: hypothetical protein PPHEMADM_0168 [uncultured Paraburkholderia sp.]|nr:MAG: hypothetical protein PPHEMADM_0168 [uncultured Paraburkholderia sp.]
MAAAESATSVATSAATSTATPPNPAASPPRFMNASRQAVPARREVQETSKPLAPYAVEHQLQLLISYRTVL